MGRGGVQMLGLTPTPLGEARGPDIQGALDFGELAWRGGRRSTEETFHGLYMRVFI